MKSYINKPIKSSSEMKLMLRLQEWRMYLFNLDSYMRHCGICGHAWGLCDLFCEKCWRKYYLDTIEVCSAQIPVRGVCLWEWGNQNDVTLKKLIYSFKGGELTPVAERLALKMAFELFNKYPEIKKDIVIIPAPARVLGSKDHAYLLGDCIAKLLNTELLLKFKREDGSGLQKRKSRSERWNVSLSTVEGANSISNSCSVIFVDDVVTTGATVMNAYKLLNQPTSFYYVSIAYKKLNGGDSSIEKE